MDTRTVKPPKKEADSELLTREHLIWRSVVLRKADFQCEWIENGFRCERRHPKHRLFADHIIERRDGGDPLDPDNGQALCGAHHTIKTAQMRAARMQGLF